MQAFCCSRSQSSAEDVWDQQVALLMEQIHSLFVCLMNHWVTDQQWAIEAVQTEKKPSRELVSPPRSFEARLAPRAAREAWGLLPMVPRKAGSEERVLFLIGWWKSAQGTETKGPSVKRGGSENIWIKGWGKNQETGVCSEPRNNPHLASLPRSSGSNQVGKDRKK